MILSRNLEYFDGQRLEMLKYVPDSSQIILDVGCGQGKFGEQLMRMDKKVWGVEPFHDAAVLAKGLLSTVLEGKIEEVIDRIPDNYFDVIVLNDVLEHLADPWEILAKLKGKLNPGGKVIASIPNFRYITNLFQLLVRKDIEYCDSGILDSTHLRFFTKKSMTRMFLSNGYVIDKIEGIEATRSFYGFVLAMIVNLLTLMSNRDIFYKQFVFIAS